MSREVLHIKEWIKIKKLNDTFKFWEEFCEENNYNLWNYKSVTVTPDTPRVIIGDDRIVFRVEKQK